MKLSPWQQTFLDVDIIEAADEDFDDPELIRALHEGNYTHPLVLDRILDRANDIDISIADRTTEEQGYGTPAEAKKLMAGGYSLLEKLRKERRR